MRKMSFAIIFVIRYYFSKSVADDKKMATNLSHPCMQVSLQCDFVVPFIKMWSVEFISPPPEFGLGYVFFFGKNIFRSIIKNF